MQMSRRRVILYAFSGLILMAVAWAVFQSVRIYPIAQRARTHATSLLALRTASPNVILTAPALKGATTDLRELNGALTELQKTLTFELALAGRVSWLPAIGGDIASAPILLDAGIAATAAANAFLAGAVPLAELHQATTLESRAYDRDGSALVALQDAQPEWEAAAKSLKRVARHLERWESLPTGKIVAPRLEPYLEEFGALLPLAIEALETAADQPEVIDAIIGLSRPRSYLVLMQNSWELRPTGGFITAAVMATIAAGETQFSAFVDSYRVDLDYAALPPPPATLRNALWGGIWTFRDANWSPDFPTSAQWAKDLYLIGRDEAIDGVIALDPALVENLLAVVGPVWVPEYGTDVSAVDLWDKLAQFHDLPQGIEKSANPEQTAVEQRKAFLPSVTEPLLARVRKGFGNPRELMGLILAMEESLREKHLLITVEDETTARWLGDHAWDGSLWQGKGDYVQVVDSNVGFNKADARIQRHITYTVRLDSEGAGNAQIVIEYQNTSALQTTECVQELVPGGYESTWLDACYWTYVRVYAPAGSQLLAAEPSTWPEGSLWRRANPASQTPATYVGQDPAGKEIFGVLLAVPPGETRTVRFDYALPALTWTPSNGYQLYVQKQAGTIETPVEVLVQPPDGAAIVTADTGALDRKAFFRLALSEDRQISVQLQGETVTNLAARPSPAPTVRASVTPIPTRAPTTVPTRGPSPTPIILLVTATPSPRPEWTPSPHTAPVHQQTPIARTWARVQVPAVDIDTAIVPVGWQLVGPPEARYAEWEVAAFAAGHHKDSAAPGETGNVVLSGHHNILGEVFRDLWLLEPDDEILLTDSAGAVYRYKVREVNILPDAGASPEVRASYLRYLQQTQEPILTMVTCWPYESNTHRTIVVADLVQ